MQPKGEGECRSTTVLPAVVHFLVEETYRSELGADRKSTRLNSSHLGISHAVFCLKKNRAGPSIRIRASVQWPKLAASSKVKGMANRDSLGMPRIVSIGAARCYPPGSVFFLSVRRRPGPPLFPCGGPLR